LQAEWRTAIGNDSGHCEADFDEMLSWSIAAIEAEMKAEMKRTRWVPLSFRSPFRSPFRPPIYLP
jgi:hypothetical protein